MDNLLEARGKWIIYSRHELKRKIGGIFEELEGITDET